MAVSLLEISAGESDLDGSTEDSETQKLMGQTPEEASSLKKKICCVALVVGLFLLLDSIDLGPWRIGKEDHTTLKSTVHVQQRCINVGMNENGSYSPATEDSDGVVGDDYWPAIPDEHWQCMPRVSYPRKLTASWCNPGARNDSTAGLIFTKVHKAASTTVASVNMRIASHHNCTSKQNHADSRIIGTRDNVKSFLYASIRHPARRAISWVFYSLSMRGQQNITDDSVLQALQERLFYVGDNDPDTLNMNDAGAQTGFMHTGSHLPEGLWQPSLPHVVQQFSIATERVQQVMDQYDFIMIVERLPESLVVLQLLLNLPTTDILYLSAKKSGSYFHRQHPPSPRCHKLTKSFYSPNIKAYLSSPQWYAQNYEDYLLYKAANASLDLTIEQLGRDRFNRALADYQDMMVQAKECEEETIFPCSSDGAHNEVTNCCSADLGCGYSCLDRRFGRTGPI